MTNSRKSLLAFKAPKDPAENLRYRAAILRRSKRDAEFRRLLWIACKRDIVFFVDTFCWTFDPDQSEMRRRPFILYPEQEIHIREMVDSIHQRVSHGILKSRRLGFSWMGMAMALHTFLFMQESTGVVASRTETDVDAPGDPKSLFWKIQFMLERLPSWLQPRGWQDERRALHFGNPVNGATIDGVSTTPNMARGGGATYIWVDEGAFIECLMQALKSINAISRCRFMVSTPAGAFGGYYVAYHKCDKQLKYHWSDFPPFAAGLYTSKDGVLEILDKDYAFPPDYPFVLDGKLRSIAYDRWCNEASSPQEVAQERDCEFLGSGWDFFNPGRIQVARQKMTVAPFRRASVAFDRDTSELLAVNEEQNAPLLLWLNLSPRDNAVPGKRNFVVACDIAQSSATGVAPTESVAVVVDADTKEKVAEFATRTMRPDEFAMFCVGLAKWFNNALLIWDAGGPGHSFGNTVIATGYANIWYRRDEKRADKPVSKDPGFYIVKGTKEPLLEAYKAALEDGRYINRSDKALAECLEYQRMPDRSIEHQAAKASEDPAGSGENHGDRVIADALAWWAIRDTQTDVPPPEPQQALIFSRQWRDEKARAKHRHGRSLMPSSEKW